MGRLYPGEDLSDADLRHRNGDLDSHVRRDAEAAVLMGNLSLRVGMGGRYDAANHDEHNAQHAEEDSPRRPHRRGCDFAQHPMNIAQVYERGEVRSLEGTGQVWIGGLIETP